MTWPTWLSQHQYTFSWFTYLKVVVLWCFAAKKHQTTGGHLGLSVAGLFHQRWGLHPRRPGQGRGRTRSEGQAGQAMEGPPLSSMDQWSFQFEGFNGSMDQWSPQNLRPLFFPLSLATLCNIRWIPSDFPRKRSGRSARKSSARSARKLRRSAPTRSPLRSRSLDGSSMKQCCWWVVLWEFSHLNYRLKKRGANMV